MCVPAIFVTMTDGAFPPPPPVGAGSTPPPSPSAPPPPPPPGLTPPPGYTAYNTGPTPTAQVSRIGGIAKAAMVLTAISGLTGIVVAFLLVPVNDKASDFLAGTISADDFNDTYQPVQLIQTLQSVIGIAAGVVTIIWMFKIANNLRAFSRRTTWHPLFSIFGWLLPPFLFLIPLLILREMWKASDPASPAGTDSWRSSSDNPLLYVWFVTYGVIPFAITALTIGAVIDAALNASGDERVAAEAVDAASTYSLISGVVVLVAAAIWIIFVKQLTQRHTTLTGER